MSKSLEVQEIAIVLTANNYDPNLLNPNFLKYSGIINEEWELAKQPIVSNRGSQVVFNNGIYLAGQANRFTFVEALNNKEEAQIEIPELIKRYIEVLRNLEYKALGINFRGYVSLNDEQGESNNYLSNNFIVPGKWQKCGTGDVKVGLNMVFTYESKQLFLSANEASLKFSEEEQLPIALFSGNFNYDLDKYSSEAKLEEILSTISNWQDDLGIYKDVIHKMINNQETKVTQSEKEVVLVS